MKISMSDLGKSIGFYNAFDGTQTDLEKLFKNQNEFLLEKDHLGRTLLMHSAINDNAKNVIFLLKKGACITERDNLGATALHWATRCGSLKAARTLLECANKNEQCLIFVADNEQVTPLHVAATIGSSKMLKLFEEFIYPEIRGERSKIPLDKRGRSPLHYAASRANIDCVRHFLDSAKMDLIVDQKDKFQLTPLMCAVGVNLSQAVAVCDALAKRKPVSVSSRNRDGQTALHLAVAAGNVSVVKSLLLEHSAQVDALDTKNRTPLHYAAEQGEEDIVRLLLDNGASVLAKDSFGVVPAFYAAQVSKECLQMILPKMCQKDVKDIKDKEQRTCLMWAVCAGNEDVVSYLLQSDVDRKEGDIYGFTALHLAAMTNNENMCKLLIRQGWNTSERDKQDNTPMHLAAGRGHVEVVRSLVTMSANMNDKDALGRTPIFWACLGGQPHTAHVMIKELGFEWRTAEGGRRSRPFTDTLGRTPLHAAAFAGFSACITILLNIEREDDCLCSPLIGWADMEGQTALHVASREGRSDCVKLLVREGAGINALDRERKTPLEYSSDPAISEYLKKNGAMSGLEVANIAAATITRSIRRYIIMKRAGKLRNATYTRRF